MGSAWTAIWDNGLLRLIFESLQFFYGWVHDYGFAIILLTLAFRILLIPITWKQTKSMYELQEIQPKIKALQEKHKDDKEKQSEELMKFYQENKVNPFGGCLPLLAQMPLFIALFQVLQRALPTYLATLPVAEQAAAKHFWVILPDITMTPQHVYQVASTAATQTAGIGGAAGTIATSTVMPGVGGVVPGVVAMLPYLLFVALFGLSVWLPQYMMTKDPTQRRTGTYMAVMMLYFGFVSPAGVLIYWVTSSAWQVGQQLITQRWLAARKAEAEESAGSTSKKAAGSDKSETPAPAAKALPKAKGQTQGQGKKNKPKTGPGKKGS